MNNPLYQQTRFPVFQNRMYDTALEAESCPTGDIDLVEDTTSGLVYNRAFDANLMRYDGHYQNEQAVSPLFRAHLESVAARIGSFMGRTGLVEVGCGKAYFLEMLLADGFDVTGFDPTYEGENPRVQRRYFEPGVMQRCEGIILRHVLEHVERPVEFLFRLREANGGRGLIYIEVPCFDWICDHRAWFDIFYEHVNYFRLRDFHRMFGDVRVSGRAFGEQYLYVIADLATLRVPQFDRQERVQFPNDFMRGALSDAPSDAAVIWGGASKGVIFALLRARAGMPVSTVIDINPAKQGSYLPGTGLLVKSPELALRDMPTGSTIYVMNSNYLEEVKQMTRNAFKYICVDNA